MIKKGDAVIKREILDDVISQLGRDTVIVLKGARQVGKVTLLLERNLR